MKKIILDTNFLLIPFIFKVDIFSEIDRVVEDEHSIHIIDDTIRELNKICNGQQGKDKEAARFALNLIEKKKIGMLKGTKDFVDDSIVDLVTDNQDYLVCTQDKELKDRLRRVGAGIIVLRQKKYLAMSA